MHYFQPKLPSWKQNLWMFHSSLTFQPKILTYQLQHKPIDSILITVSSDASFLVMFPLILHSQCSYIGMSSRESKNVVVLFLLQQIRKIAERRLCGRDLTSLATTETRMSQGVDYSKYGDNQ